jgi:uncharacterized membrane protein YphA (DoxX/SURF4 family)
MKLENNSKRIFIELVCLLYVLLFVYAAVSKLMDFENFKVQLGQSPLISTFASWVSWLVPLVELFIAILLVFPKSRIYGLLAALSMMIMFTAYIFIILNYSAFVPCSCGGILEKMDWTEHLIFNFVFVIVAIFAIVFDRSVRDSWIREMKLLPYSASLFSFCMVSAGVVIGLYLLSEEIMHRQNPFIRRFPHHPVVLKQTSDLKFNSYYFAGYFAGRIYLGNYSAPLHVLSLDSTLRNRQEVRIALGRTDLPFQSVKIAVRAPYFYLMDGTVPSIFRGTIKDWRANIMLKDSPYFTIAEPIDSSRFVFRANSRNNGDNILGIFSAEQPSKVHLAATLLQKQIDGIFDTDGILHYSDELKRMVYVYSYRNQFIVADDKGKLDYRGNTIDTITQASIKVAYLKKGAERKMSAPPLTVNATSSISQQLLFVHSKVSGRYEQKKVWNQASVIDVYDLEKKEYVFSFHIYGIQDKRLSSFWVTTTHLFVLIDTSLVVYELQDILKNKMKRATGKSS